MASPISFENSSRLSRTIGWIFSSSFWPYSMCRPRPVEKSFYCFFICSILLNRLCRFSAVKLLLISVTFGLPVTMKLGGRTSEVSRCRVCKVWAYAAICVSFLEASIVFCFTDRLLRKALFCSSKRPLISDFLTVTLKDMPCLWIIEGLVWYLSSI